MLRRLVGFWRLLNLPCRDMTALYSRAMDARLPWRERFAARLHLLYCSACRHYLRQLRMLREAARRVAAVERSPEARHAAPGEVGVVDAPAEPPALSADARRRIGRRLGGE